MRNNLFRVILHTMMFYGVLFSTSVCTRSNAQTGTATLLSPVVLLSPRNDSMNIRGEATLIWQRKDSAAEYRIEMSKHPNFDTVLLNDTIAARSYSVNTLERVTVYYWHVRGIDGSGISGEWSNTWRFTTSRGKPLMPVQVFPEDRAKDVAYRGLDLFWREDTLASSYTLQVSRDSNFQGSVSNVVGLTMNHATIDHLDSLTTYYWRVTAMNEEGIGMWSAVHSFTTKAPPLLVQDIVASQNATIYPNPATSIFQVRGPQLRAIYLTDLLGHQFYFSITGNTPVDVRQLPRGVYTVQLVGSTGVILSTPPLHVLLQ